MNLSFWGQSTSDCRANLKSVLHSCGPTKFAFIPHGKPLHHGGCMQMPWMVETIDRLKTHVDLNKTVILLTPGAHFSVFNPAVYLNRLIELRVKLYRLKLDFPGVKILFRTTNFFPNDFSDNSAVLSGYNAKRLDKIAQKVFNDKRFVTMVPVYDMSEVVFDAFGDSELSFHPNTWLQTGIVFHILEKL